MGDAAVEHHEIIIAGGGFAGLAMALALKRDGREDFVILERADALGGTWRDNRYPGCACDVPSVVYQLADEPNPGWTRAFAGQEEILAYLHDVAGRGDVTAHLRFGHDLLAADWDDDTQQWVVVTSQGTFTATVLISAVGALADPALPDLPGLDTFAGRHFHSAAWDDGAAIDGARVAVVGTGASAVQFVPEIRPRTAHLTVFQRTPPWVIGRPDIGIDERWRARFARFPRLARRVRGAVAALLELRQTTFRHPRLMALVNERQGRRLLDRQVRDPELRRRLTPSYRMGCKRILLSSTWYRAVTAENAEVVTEPIAEIVPEGVVDAAGTLHAADTIIFATGFRVTDQPIAHKVRGRDGRTLDAHWDGSPKAYYGTAVAGFPNLFLLLGPNTGLGHSSVVLMIEAQVRYVMAALAFRDRQALDTLEPRAEAQAEYVAEVDAAMQGSVWTAGGCQSWYLDRTGRNSALWPQTVRRFERRIARFEPADHELGFAGGPGTATTDAVTA
jgi:cation diffusion facilitator CzcD-associated flavoprotein CzcO